MNGQWLGEYSGTNADKIMVNLDDTERNAKR